jgi:hypothetical protein
MLLSSGLKLVFWLATLSVKGLVKYDLPIAKKINL